MNQAIPASQLVLNSEGTVYHLALHPEELADDVILVGDPGRVDMIASYFEKIEVKRQNRELWSRTGYYNGKRITVLSTGMGTDNLDIVMNELDTLANTPPSRGKIFGKESRCLHAPSLPDVRGGEHP